MNVLVTGAAGFIGSHLTRLMLSEGHAVTAVLSSSTQTKRIQDLLPRLTIIACDVGDRIEIQRRLCDAPPDVCIHLAWRGWSGPSLAAEENLTSLAASLEFLRAMADIGCPRYVGIGTCFEYEPQSAPMSEVTPTLPRDLYGVCKHALSVAAQKTADITRMQVAWARVFLVYGPHDDERRLVPSVALSLIRGEVAQTTLGEQVRDVLHVEDAASAIWAVARSQHTGPVNVASGSPIAVADIVRRISVLVGQPEQLRIGALAYRQGEPPFLVANVAVLRDVIGWRPKFDLEAGLSNAIDWWRARVANRQRDASAGYANR
jgi:nucleoside-diphosphate-sugar epimerase